MKRKGWFKEPKQHALAARGIKTKSPRKEDIAQRPPMPFRTWSEWREFQKEANEDVYDAKVDSLVDELEGDKTLPYIKEDEFIATRTGTGVQVLDTKRKIATETLIHENPEEFHKMESGLRISTTPKYTTHIYYHPNEYQKRYKKYLEKKHE